MEMNSVLNSFERLGNAVFSEVARFDPVTWGVLAVCTVVFGFMLLRGNILK